MKLDQLRYADLQFYLALVLSSALMNSLQKSYASFHSIIKLFPWNFIVFGKRYDTKCAQKSLTEYSRQEMVRNNF